MTPDEIKQIRHSLGISAREFAALIGYEDDRTIRRIEAGERSISKSATKLLTYIMQGHLDETMRSVIPEHLVGTGARDKDGNEFVMRMYTPRFLAVVSTPIAGLDYVELVEGEAINIVMWIDDPEGHNISELLARAATDFEIYTQDCFDE